MTEQEHPQPSAFFLDLAADLHDPEFRIAFAARQREMAMESLRRMVDRVRSMPDRGGVAAALTGGPGDDPELLLREWLTQVDMPVIRYPSLNDLMTPESLRALTASLPDEPAVVIIEDFLRRHTAADHRTESYLQIEWDHRMSRKPVVLVITGDEPAVHEMLGYDRPLYGRLTPVPVGLPHRYKIDLAAAEQWLAEGTRRTNAQAYGNWLTNQTPAERAESAGLDDVEASARDATLDGTEWPDEGDR